MQLSSVLVLVADEAYLPHAKSVFVNAKRQGRWEGDYCLVAPPSVDRKYFENRGINVLVDDQERHYRKFAIVDDFFKKWDIVLYTDCDVLIQKPLEPLLHEVGWGEILADREMFTLEHAFTFWATEEDLKKPERVQVFDWLWKQYDRNRQQFNTGVLLYHPRTLIPNARQMLVEMKGKIAPINCHVVNGTDQPIFNLVFYDRFTRIKNDAVCYWNSTWKETIITHTCSGYAPWIAKEHKDGSVFNATSEPIYPDAYWCEHIGLSMHDIYKANLEAFETEFPVKS